MKNHFNNSHSSLEAPSSIKNGNIVPTFRLQDKQDPKNAEMSQSTLADMVMNVCHLLTVKDHQGSKLWLKKLIGSPHLASQHNKKAADVDLDDLKWAKLAA